MESNLPVKRGGPRKGSGRPRNLTKAIAKAERDHKELAVAIKGGLGQIAKAVPDLIETAVMLALGYDSETRDGKPHKYQPDPKMIKILLDYGIAALEVEDLTLPEEESTPAKIIKKAIERGNITTPEIHLHQTVIERPPDPLNLFTDVRDSDAVSVGRTGGDRNDEPQTA